ncbi:MAG TPA: CopG family transcriptional regulator [Acidimicrobiales bacterium]|nr:CopG family transcriptional regulator [Acidimicrobiales bacterium]
MTKLHVVVVPFKGEWGVAIKQDRKNVREPEGPFSKDKANEVAAATRRRLGLTREPQEGSSDRRIKVLLSTSTLARLDEMAEQANCSRSEIIRRIVARAV